MSEKSLKACELFRANPKQKISDDSARTTPLASGSTAASKAADKQRTIEIGAEIAALQTMFYAEHKRKFLLVLQGMDTAGKDRTISSLFSMVNPMGLRACGFKTPSVDELAHDYLWRVHSQVPVLGEIVVFNRSHYEDVLITRVNEWIDDKECKRRFAQIRDFERMLVETGTIIVKVFLHISKDQQRIRLQERLDEADKQWKFNAGDVEQRKLWDQYQAQYQQVIRETDTNDAPWYVVPSDSKTHRNLAVSTILLETLQGLKLAYPQHPEYAKLKIS